MHNCPIFDNCVSLGILYNAALNSEKEDAASWAEAKYPSEWTTLQALGKTDTGLYKINRQLSP